MTTALTISGDNLVITDAGGNRLYPSAAQLLFSDGFGTFDTSRWSASAMLSDAAWTQDQFLPANVTADGVLHMRVTQGTPSGRPYGASLIASKQTWLYGYFEARCKCPANGNGLWPGFWMNAPPGTYPEIDILEWLSNTPTTHRIALHMDVPRHDWGLDHVGPDLSAGWHTYGLDWQPGYIAVYFDGAEVWRATAGQMLDGTAVAIPAVPMQILFDHATGGWAGNAVDASTTFPADFQVGWVKVWDRR